MYKVHTVHREVHSPVGSRFHDTILRGKKMRKVVVVVTRDVTDSGLESAPEYEFGSFEIKIMLRRS